MKRYRDKTAIVLGERLANYKVPKQVIFADSLPKTATGEIRKEDLW